jgi:hypothetical protein
MAFALTLVGLDFFLLLLNRDPNAVTLEDGWGLGEMLFAHAMHQWLDLIDELIERAQPNGTLQLCTPAISDRPQALAQTTAEQGILLQVHPKPLKFLQDTKATRHIMMTALTLQHRNRQLLDMSPFCLERSSVMAVSRELIGVLASTLSTLPVTFARRLTHRAPTAFFASQFGRYLRFEKGIDDLLGGL